MREADAETPPGEQGATNETGADVTHSALQDVLWTNKDQINV